MNRGKQVMSTSTLARLTASLIICVALYHSAGAMTLISNTDQPVLGGVPNVFASQWVAAPFVTGAAPAQLNSVTLYEWTFSSPTGSYFLSVYGDNKGLPG